MTYHPTPSSSTSVFSTAKARALSTAISVPSRSHCAAVLVSIAFAGTASVAQANAIPDPSFEASAASSKWKRSDSTSSLTTTRKRTGQQSLRLLNNGNGVKGTRKHDVVQSNIPVAGVTPGQEYAFTVYVRGENVTGIGGGGKPLTVLRWKSAKNGKLAEELYNWAPYGNYDFTKMTLHFQAPAGASKIDVGVRSWYDCLTGYTYWDDAQLVPRVVAGRGALQKTYEAESANKKTGGKVLSSIGGYSGSGYFDVTTNGAILEWNNVAGGGKRVVAARYSWEGASKPLELFVNGVSQGKKNKPVWTGRRGSYATENWTVNLPAGNNKVTLKIGKGKGGTKIQPLIDRLEVYSAN